MSSPRTALSRTELQAGARTAGRRQSNRLCQLPPCDERCAPQTPAAWYRQQQARRPNDHRCSSSALGFEVPGDIDPHLAVADQVVNGATLQHRLLKVSKL